MPAKRARCCLMHFCLKRCWVAVGGSCSPSGMAGAVPEPFTEVALRVVHPSSFHLLLPQHQPIRPLWRHHVLVSHLLSGRSKLAFDKLVKCLSNHLCAFCLFVFSVTQAHGALRSTKLVCFAVSVPLLWNAAWV